MFLRPGPSLWSSPGSVELRLLEFRMLSDDRSTAGRPVGHRLLAGWRGHRAAGRRPQLRGAPLAHPAGHDLCPRAAPQPPDRPDRSCPPTLAAPHQRSPTRRPVPPAPHCRANTGRGRVSVGVRSLDGIADGHSGGVRQCRRQDRSCSARPPEWPCHPDTDLAHVRRLWPPVAALRTASGRAAPGAHVRGGCREDYLSTLMAGLRSAAGHRPGSQSAADTGMAATPAWPRVPDSSRSVWVVPEAADGQSADGSGSLQLPLLLLKAGPAGGRLRRPSSAGSTRLAEQPGRVS